MHTLKEALAAASSFICGTAPPFSGKLILAMIDRELESLAAQQGAQEPVLRQSRMRATWWRDTKAWTAWEYCSPESYEDLEKLSKLPNYQDWQYEVRKLYAHPAAKAEPAKELSDAEIMAIRDAVHYSEGWDGDQFDLTFARKLLASTGAKP